jgi:hypothetical protein
LPYALVIDDEIGPPIVPWSAYLLHDGFGSTGLAAPTDFVAVPVEADADHPPVKPFPETLSGLASSKSATTAVLATAQVRAPASLAELDPEPLPLPLPLVLVPLPLFDCVPVPLLFDCVPVPLLTLVDVTVETTVLVPPSAR